MGGGVGGLGNGRAAIVRADAGFGDTGILRAICPCLDTGEEDRNLFFIFFIKKQLYHKQNFFENLPRIKVELLLNHGG